MVFVWNKEERIFGDSLSLDKLKQKDEGRESKRN